MQQKQTNLCKWIGTKIEEGEKGYLEMDESKKRGSSTNEAEPNTTS